MGRLYQTVSGATTVRHAYDGLDLIAQYDGSNALRRRFVFGPGVDEPLVQYEGAGTADRRFLHADERGSIVASSDSAGNALAINSYDEYGIPGSSNQGRFQYTGQAWIAELGLYNYKNRMYSPTLGRFLQTDPIGYGDGMNMYAYVGNDPVNFTDPLGLDPVDIVTHFQTNLDGGASGSDIIVTGSLPVRFDFRDIGVISPGGPVPKAGVGEFPGGEMRGQLPECPDAPIDASQAARCTVTVTAKKPAYCGSELYRALDDFDRLAGYAQGLALGAGAVGQAEQYRAMRLAARSGAIAAYATITKIRFGLNLGKAFFGDYRGAVTDVALGIIGRSAGLDQLGQLITGEAGAAIGRRVGGSPCR